MSSRGGQQQIGESSVRDSRERPALFNPHLTSKERNLTIEAKIILDSISPAGARLTTLELTYPRFIHSEVLTHRDRARNSASSRAIPWPKMVARIEHDPVIPLVFGAEQQGMQTGDEVDDRLKAERIWLQAKQAAVYYARRLAEVGVHKSICNRITEPWMHITTIMTATEWANFFRQRCHPDAEIHFQKLACAIRDAMAVSVPVEVHTDCWHTPYIQPDETWIDEETRLRVSVARCARVSYLTHDGQRSIDKDLELHDRLCNGSGFGHWSPFEHVAQAHDSRDHLSGPFRGWRQYRKLFPLENKEG